jgi:HEAT repeat protein
MSEAREVNRSAGRSGEVEDAGRLVAELGGSDGMKRKAAREVLVSLGEPSVDVLLPLLGARSDILRWEAAKALSEIGSPVAGPALVRALEDGSSGVRWLAAQGLIAAGGVVVPLVLEALIDRSGSSLLMTGAHHVLHDTAKADPAVRPVLRPVLEALEGIDPTSEVPPAAAEALRALRG